jgi:hypothetical protein
MADGSREYPEAPDRSGRPEDFKNFPNFIEKLKASLMVYGKELSITLPASYCKSSLVSLATKLVSKPRSQGTFSILTLSN